MTPVQAKLYAYLLERVEDPVSPTMDQMREALGLANRGRVHVLVGDLERLGLVTRIPNRRNSVRAVKKNPLDGISSDALRDELVRRGELIDGR